MYIVQVLPRRIPGKAAGALNSRTLIYMDSEMWFEPYIDEYDQQGRLWLNHIWWTAYRDRPVPDAKIAIYPFKRSFEVGAVSTDVQSGLATMCYLPGWKPPNASAGTSTWVRSTDPTSQLTRWCVPQTSDLGAEVVRLIRGAPPKSSEFKITRMVQLFARVWRDRGREVCGGKLSGLNVLRSSKPPRTGALYSPRNIFGR